MNERHQAVFRDPAEFRRFLDDCTPRSVVFHGADQNRRSNVTCPYFRALVTLNGERCTATLELSPEIPKDWEHGANRTIVAEYENKLDFVVFLRAQPGIDENTLKKFDKVKAKTLREVIDSSKESTEEMTVRRTEDKNEEFDIGCDLGTVHVTIYKARAHLNYKATIDFSAAWQALEDAARQQLNSYLIFEGTLD